MLLRSGKLKLALHHQRTDKHRKMVKRDELYINTANCDELSKLYGIGRVHAKQIIFEREKQRFLSDSDLIQRIGAISEETFEFSPVTISYYNTKYEFECDKIYKSLLDIVTLKNYPTDALSVIAEFAIGNIEKCSNINCNEEVLITKGHQIETDRKINGRDVMDGYQCGYVRCLPDKQHCIYLDPLRKMELYYMRKDKLFGNALYCYQCVNNLKYLKCDKGLKYFMGNDDHRLFNCIAIGNICECDWKSQERKIMKEKFIKHVLPTLMYIYCPCSTHTATTRYKQILQCDFDKELTQTCMQEI